mmetsp:Transcript_47602/g.119850  ORF Transcript_47602/g.119850 Transcript_47602/m.119850 type:complete len:340 (-) Transcript_47602:312-1331(-)|eukprot:CAMPEP_0177657168 /NCGR_PEP_ID=MMETSP0447-20121125/16024_1 /TAXON_ID=0 /ORGANISM="Stygamoeba regulata, Strain BSH-02190019" /LENGTH=339 /DNA_ID=CAMNT_0019161471 /DNA_START=85 /DNA_END=1107 /DNA_ORIENTATION=-
MRTPLLLAACGASLGVSLGVAHAASLLDAPGWPPIPGHTLSICLLAVGVCAVVAAWRRRRGAMPRDYGFDPRTLNAPDVTRWMNFGLWDRPHMIFPEACAALATRVQDAAGIKDGDCVVDMGCGYFESGVSLCQRFPRVHVCGLEVCDGVVAAARSRVKEARLCHRASVHPGSALHPPFPDCTADAVTAVDCAYHFTPRPLFLQQAARILRPGGRLSFTDFYLNQKTHSPFLPAVCWMIGGSITHTRADFVQMLTDCGFCDIQCTPITQSVIPGFAQHVRDRARQAPLTFLPFVMVSWVLQWISCDAEYALITARKVQVEEGSIPGECNGRPTDGQQSS